MKPDVQQCLRRSMPDPGRTVFYPTSRICVTSYFHTDSREYLGTEYACGAKLLQGREIDPPACEIDVCHCFECLAGAS